MCSFPPVPPTPTPLHPRPAPPHSPPAPHAVLSASLDGTVRAFDLVRYRNFRTLTTPEPVQFVSMTVDPGGEVCLRVSAYVCVCAYVSVGARGCVGVVAACREPVVSPSL
jgi:hypothetical protein